MPEVKLQIRSAVIEGKYRHGQQLPSLEQLANQLGVAGLTAKKAVDELVREGWLTSRHGVGTFVHIKDSSSKVVLTAPRQFGSEVFLRTDLLEAFHKLHPNVRITLTSDSPTDIVVTNSYALVADRLRKQQLLSIEELCERFAKKPWDLPERVSALLSWQGKQFALPIRVDLVLLQINPRLLQRIGVSAPTTYLDWDMWRKIMQRCRLDLDDDGFAECFGAFSKAGLYEWLVPFWQNGGRLDDRKAFFESKGFSVLDELWQMHHIQKTVPLETASSGGEFSNKVIKRRFQSEQVAVRWMTSSEIFDLPPFQSSVVLPRFGAHPRQEVHALGLGIHRDTAHPDVALAFLDFCYERFVRNNPVYPFAIGDEQRLLLQELPEIHRLFQEGFSDASEPLHEGNPQRTWAIEKEIFEWFRLLQNRETTFRKLHEHWDRWAATAVSARKGQSVLVAHDAESTGPAGMFALGESQTNMEENV